MVLSTLDTNSWTLVGNNAAILNISLISQSLCEVMNYQRKQT